MPSPFLTPGSVAQPNDLAILHLRRDQTISTVLRTNDDENLGYSEGKVTNTRFGSFPHSTLMNQPWGSQIIASKVDTGSRGRKQKQRPTATKGQKRKADELNNDDKATTTTEVASASPKTSPTAAPSGFVHLFYPTPEAWTLSLPHRTQVVYTPDYSYILERLRARPGGTVIEAGSGSGSFMHAAARAVFNGYPEYEHGHITNTETKRHSKKRRLGKVCSFEFHEQRVGKVREEVQQHGLDGIVQVTHRDVYGDGFLLDDGTSPKANVVFLDLPAPWLALKHLVRRPASETETESPLDPSSPIQLCTFSPCLEQAQRTISAMRRLGWLNISMEELQHRRIDVRREICGLEAEGMRGAIIFPKSVEEAVVRSRSVEERAKWFREHVQRTEDASQDKDEQQQEHEQETKANPTTTDDNPSADGPPSPKPRPNITGPTYEMGHLVHRSELDLKMHTSYLVFAVLPRDWSEEDERKCREAWPVRAPVNTDTSQATERKSRKQIKREEKNQEKIEKALLQEREKEKEKGKSAIEESQQNGA